VLCERIAVPNLILRLRETGMTAHQLKIALLVAIQHEFEYNISQQVYVSESLWQILKAARDYTVNKISYIADGIDPQANASELAVALLNDAEENASALDKALLAIKSEAAGFM
ncbi:MAG: hypothetical protein KA974_02335, partial [Saprospiraceae bacterium]|nr:hypothetical protein [Saprospiraceae bacterium]